MWEVKLAVPSIMDFEQSIYQTEEGFPEAENVPRSRGLFVFAKVTVQIALVGIFQYQIETVLDDETAIISHNISMWSGSI